MDVLIRHGAVYSTFDQEYNRQVNPAPFILGSTIAESQQAGACVTTPIWTSVSRQMGSWAFHRDHRRQRS